MEIFDRRLLRHLKDKSFDSFYDTSFLHEAILDGLALRLFAKPSYSRALIIGLRNLPEASKIIHHQNISHLVYADNSIKFLNEYSGDKILMDEEFLPFASESFDLVISILNMHSINNMGAYLNNVRRIMKNGGLFIGSLFGSKTLYELKNAMVNCEIDLGLATSPHIHPMTEVKEIGAFAAKCGFIEPVSDSETIIVHYSDLIRLFKDIKNMGESNILKDKNKKILPKHFFNRLKNIYQKNFAFSEDGQIFYPATFEIIHISGFK
jgi:NADH dehydrogenase [ubiquinone] 1 alpha subcomplex assembly factor 5